tara:strand:- start:73 stop:1299 length:1227 start_codon:yes stop_codon:yes gene_type:complete
MNLVIHYSEIGTKGKNRDFFEKKLMDNLRKALGSQSTKVYRRYGRIIVDLKEKFDQEKSVNILAILPGISSFAFASQTDLDFENIKKTGKKVLMETLDILNEKNLKLKKGIKSEKQKFLTFKVETKRSNKQFPMKSPEINKELGKYLEKELDLIAEYKNPDIKLQLEIGEKETFIYSKKYYGVGGLPIGTAGKVIASLSGGIDSPVASFLAMKRGCEVIFMHAYNKTQVTTGVLSKLEDLVKQLAKIQLKARLYIIPFEKIQKEIILKVPAKLRMIIYRRFMMQIINEIAKKEKAKAIITGDSVGQVASQTLDNINCIYAAANIPVLAPLIGMNKEEIVNLAKKIGTYEISIQPYPDCCSFNIAQHPETRGKLAEIEKVEENIENKKELIIEAIEKTKIKNINSGIKT